MGVASTHPMLDPARKIESVDFNCGTQGNRNELNVSGKRKRVRSAAARSTAVCLPRTFYSCYRLCWFNSTGLS